MPISYKKTVAVLEGVCTVEEAETLWEWLRNNPGGKINLKACEHIHTSILQVLMASGAKISALPADPWLTGLVECVLPEKAC